MGSLQARIVSFMTFLNLETDYKTPEILRRSFVVNAVASYSSSPKIIAELPNFSASNKQEPH